MFAESWVRIDDVESWEYYEVPFGIMKKRTYKNGRVDQHPLVFPNILRQGNATQIRVPMDDTHTWHLSYQCYVAPDGQAAPHQDTVPVFETPLKDEQGNYRLDYILGHDLVAWAGQGASVDRSQEKLATSDRGLILFRQMLREFENR